MRSTVGSLHPAGSAGGPSSQLLRGPRNAVAPSGWHLPDHVVAVPSTGGSGGPGGVLHAVQQPQEGRVDDRGAGEVDAVAGAVDDDELGGRADLLRQPASMGE